jgi:hypothetical protein
MPWNSPGKQRPASEVCPLLKTLRFIHKSRHPEAWIRLEAKHSQSREVKKGHKWNIARKIEGVRVLFLI